MDGGSISRPNRMWEEFADYDQGLHEPLVSPEVYEMVQTAMRKNSGRPSTLNPRHRREYLLQGVVRCAHCLMPMWAQTYNSGRSYYREHRNSRSLADCPSAGGSISCGTADEQMGNIVNSVELGPRWQEQVLSIMSVSDEVERVDEKRKKAQEKLRRLGKLYLDGIYDDGKYHRQKHQIELELESLVVPQADAAEEAGGLIEQLPELWADATLSERRKLLVTMLDGVYVDAKDEKRIVAIKPKAPFRPILQVATTKGGSEIVLIRESDLDSANQPPSNGHEADADWCSWW